MLGAEQNKQKKIAPRPSLPVKQKPKEKVTCFLNVSGFVFCFFGGWGLPCRFAESSRVSQGVYITGSELDPVPPHSLIRPLWMGCFCWDSPLFPSHGASWCFTPSVHVSVWPHTQEHRGLPCPESGHWSVKVMLPVQTGKSSLESPAERPFPSPAIWS